jgi:HSP20 family molecular chaperone IbpA
VSPGGADGAFTRSVRLPVAVDAGKVAATFKNGLLTVTLAMPPAANRDGLGLLESDGAWAGRTRLWFP